MRKLILFTVHMFILQASLASEQVPSNEYVYQVDYRNRLGTSVDIAGLAGMSIRVAKETRFRREVEHSAQKEVSSRSVTEIEELAAQVP